MCYAFFQLSIEMTFAFVLLCKTSVETVPFTDTHSNSVSMGRDKTMQASAFASWLRDCFGSTGGGGRSSFPKFTLWQHKKILWENNVALSVAFMCVYVCVCVCVCHWGRLSWQTEKEDLLIAPLSWRVITGRAGQYFSSSMYRTHSQMLQTVRSSANTSCNLPKISNSSCMLMPGNWYH